MTLDPLHYWLRQHVAMQLLDRCGGELNSLNGPLWVHFEGDEKNKIWIIICFLKCCVFPKLIFSHIWGKKECKKFNKNVMCPYQVNFVHSLSSIKTPVALCWIKQNTVISKVKAHQSRFRKAAIAQNDNSRAEMTEIRKMKVK